MKRTAQCLLTAIVVCVLWGAPGAQAAEPGPGWVIRSRAVPTYFAAEPASGFANGYNLEVRNAGSRASDGSLVTVTDALEGGVIATAISGYDARPGGSVKPAALQCSLATVSCTDSLPVLPGDVLYISVTLSVSAGVQEGASVGGLASVSGGGGASASVAQSTLVSSEQAPFGIESLSTEASGVDGLPDDQAGDHPYEFTTRYYLNADAHTREFAVPSEDPKDFVVDLPAGFVGDPQIVQKCNQNLAQERACPASSQIGVATIELLGLKHESNPGEYKEGRGVPNKISIVPIYNVVPAKGVAAQFMFEIYNVPVMLYVTVSQDTNYAVRVLVKGIPRQKITGVSTTFFGSPFSDPDVYNGSVGAASLAFLQNPVDCYAGPLKTTVYTDSWQQPARWLADGSPDLSDPSWKRASNTVYPSMSGCDGLQFEPEIRVTPETTRADEPTGVNVDLRVPQSPDRFPALATPELEDASVTLPAGLSLSPSAADGLQACTDAQLDLESPEPAACPNASVLGSAKISTPLLEDPLEGRVYLGEPKCDPCSASDAADGNMLRIFLVAQGDGVRIKKQGTIYANPSTGQITTKFEDNPELPFEDLELSFKGGLRAGLATPQWCGPATTTTDFTPWSAPVTPAASPTSTFEVDWDGAGGGCPRVAPFAPAFSAGTPNPDAGQFGPLTVTFSREDREQDLAGIQVKMPPGLLGMLSQVQLCGEPQADLGTCPASTQIGTMNVAAGAGAHPFWEKGEIYITGPYEGAPFGLSIVVPTVAGPFNLGHVVVRSKINVDPTDAALTVTSDPLPQIIDGIPLRLRTANVTIDRSRFIVNPTDCAQRQITATIAGAQGAQTSVSAPFAVAGCKGLAFKPSFTASTSARTSRRNGASLEVKLKMPANSVGSEANIARVKVKLPKQLPSRLSTLQKACLAHTFEVNPSACPHGSIVGIARATTPVLPVPLSGPVYFVSHGGEAFPSLVVVLQGYGVRVDLTGSTFISKKGITSSTFKTVPDVPVGSFQLRLPEGRDSALAANANLCTHAKKLVMPTEFVAQNGTSVHQRTKIALSGCPKAKRNASASRQQRNAKAGKARRSNSDGRSTR